MIFKNLSILVLWTKVASALEGLRRRSRQKRIKQVVPYPLATSRWSCPETVRNEGTLKKCLEESVVSEELSPDLSSSMMAGLAGYKMV